MSTLTIASFTVQNFHRPGTSARLKIWFDQDFTESDGQLVLGGPTRSGSIYVDLPLELDASTKELTIPSFDLPITTNSSVRNARATGLLFDASGTFVRNLFTGWIIPEQLAPNCEYQALNAYNANRANRPPNPTFPATMEQLLTIFSSMLSNLAFATDSSGGVVFLSFPPDIDSDPVVVALNDPLFRDALKLRTIPIQDFEAIPPSDLQFLGFNASSEQWEALNPGFGLGNVISLDVVSVDRQLVVMRGTSGSGVKKIDGETGAVNIADGVLQVETLIVREVPTGTINGINDTFVLAATPIAGTESVYVAGALQNPNVVFTLDYVITDDTIVFQAGHLPQTGQSVLVTYRALA